MNLHMSVTQAEYDGILREARKQGVKLTVESHEGSPLFASLTVKLFVNPAATGRSYKYVRINDSTYSRTVARIEEGIN